MMRLRSLFCLLTVLVLLGTCGFAWAEADEIVEDIWVDPDDELAKAYTRGKLDAERKYREKLQKLAEGGNAWAIRILESKTIKQQEEELGLHG